MSSPLLRALAFATLGAIAVAAGPAVTAPTLDGSPTAVAFSADRPSYEPVWADADTAAVHPGTYMVTDGAGCTSNFVFANVETDEETGEETLANLYLGYAAHCSGTGEATDTNGCTAGSLPLGTKVDIDGAAAPGFLRYNSWLAMQDSNESNSGACSSNDFALVEIHWYDFPKVNPSLPVWGGPHGVNTTGVDTFSDLYTWGNSSLRFGTEEVSPKIQTKVSTTSDGWSHVVYAASPGIPGDSGSGHVDNQGRAFGVTSVLILLPTPAGNGITDLGRSLEYARNYTGLDLRLVNGTEQFSPIL